MKKYGTIKILCKNTKVKGTIAFYITDSTGEHFLFDQKYRKSSYEFYRNGVPFEKAIDFGKAHKDVAITNVMKRIKLTLKYLESSKIYTIPEERRKAS